MNRCKICNKKVRKKGSHLCTQHNSEYMKLYARERQEAWNSKTDDEQLLLMWNFAKKYLKNLETT